jgi:osmotically-inducible protein OsmY
MKTEAYANYSRLRDPLVIPYKGGGNTMSQKTDERITRDVLDELAWDPAVTLADLSVSTDRGRVRLNGTADTFGTKLEAEEAAYRVGGVTSVDNQIFVDPAALDLRSDADIADHIRNAFELDYQVPDERLSVSVIDGIATLTGNVDWSYQRDAAEDDAAMILGVIGLVDEITVNQPQASAVDISSGIARAFARNAELYDDNIDVTTDGGNVTLSGTVATWSEYDMANAIAWMSPGVTSVTNNVAVLFT